MFQNTELLLHTLLPCIIEKTVHRLMPNVSVYSKMSDDLYLPRNFTIDTQEYQSNLLSRLSNTHQNQISNDQSQPTRAVPPIKKVTRKRINVNELNASYGLPKDLSQNFSKWFYGDVEKLKSRRAPITGLHLSPIHSRMRIDVGTNNFKFLSQELDQRDNETLSLLGTCGVSIKDEKSIPDPTISLILESRTTLVDRRPALQKQRQKNSSSRRHKSGSLITLEEDCDDTSLIGDD